ncbi:MAG: 50S ribosomal protein L29 [Halobacteriovoraceae bacterium]|jgi:large subunit ribosomal protein L29|nr:50S ribosomal protein L29 [Halobacteriovoraceae bacterium]MBC98430.1 50S ribosomal protein L29 [Halobacteriovoraceae bacterium]|tara:strand:- start:5536 stop:5733 length:198 start_codon:yes stop_codon:yes gene_type:complete
MAEVINFKDIKDLDAAAIDAKVSELRKQIFQMNMEKATSGIEKPHGLKVLKKNIARLLTVKSANK